MPEGAPLNAGEMMLSRRTFVAGAAAGALPLALSAPARSAVRRVPAAGPSAAGRMGALAPQSILRLFADLPGTVGLKIVAPPVRRRPGLLVQSNASEQMFVGSAIKTFALCEALRRVDSPDVVKRLSQRMLSVGPSVWSVDSSIFNPPNLIGRVSERTTLEAMIMHSDNTATDMTFKLVGPRSVRRFLAGARLQRTRVPDSTRVFFGYLYGAANYRHFTWADLAAYADAEIVNPPLNPVQTLASSANDMISYYSRALQGRFFRHSETLAEFRRILSLGDAIWMLPVPLGVSAFVKGGSIDVPGFHAVCVPGGMLFENRWVYFSMTLNWPAAAETDPSTLVAFAAAGSRALALVKEALS